MREQQQVRPWSGATAARAPNAAIWAAVSAAKIPAASDACGVGVDRTDHHVQQGGERGRDQEDVDADLAPVAHLEVLAVLGARETHDRHQEQQEGEIDWARARRGPVACIVDDQEHQARRRPT